jgi:excisionase family DNA binding protein
MRELRSLKNSVPRSELREQCQKGQGEPKGVERNLDAFLLSIASLNPPILRENRRLTMQPLKSVEQAAELLAISPWTVRGYIKTGKLKPVRLGRRVLLAEDELERLVAEGQEPREAQAEPGKMLGEATR